MDPLTQSSTLAAAFCACTLAGACGGVAAVGPPSTRIDVPPAAASASSAYRAPIAAKPAVAAVPLDNARPSDNAYDDPQEENDPATLKPLFAKGQKPSLLKSTVGEHECWQDLALTGDALRDFESVVEACGTPTGATEYARPAFGQLHHRLDKADSYIVSLQGGLCYRFFGTADATIPDLDILIERDGALQGEDTTKGPVAIIDTDKAWCIDTDGQYRFIVQVHGEGQGRYAFGVWARPRR